MNTITLSDFTKQNILNCYTIMYDYITTEDPCEEESFAEMCSKLERLKIAIPAEIYDKIDKFVNTTFEPLVYEKDDFLANIRTPDLGHTNGNGDFEPNSDETAHKLAMNYLEKIDNICQQLEAFGLAELQKYLIS